MSSICIQLYIHTMGLLRSLQWSKTDLIMLTIRFDIIEQLQHRRSSNVGVAEGVASPSFSHVMSPGLSVMYHVDTTVICRVLS